MNAMWLVITALAVFTLAYRFYYSFIIARVATLNDSIPTPAHRYFDGENYYPMNKWVLFGHHFAAIAGAGPLVGPILAAQFGYFPGFLWMLLGAVLAGAVHDYILLYASVKHDGKSLAEIARREISKVSGITAAIAVIIIIIVALSGLGLVIVNALAESSWGLFTIAMTIPIAIFMGIWMFKFRPGKTGEATIIGVLLLTLAVILGRYIPGSSLEPFFKLSPWLLTLLLAIYGFLASVLPVWLLLSPRDYLSSFMKLGVAVMLGGGILIVAPTLQMPATTSFISGNGPVIAGTLFPFLFITIACGAISGFHSLVSSGTSPKMLERESHMKAVGFGSMLCESFVSILALIAAASLLPLDYFQINVAAEKFGAILPQLQDMGFTQSNIQQLSAEVGEKIEGRTGGAVSLAVGMAQIFSSIPFLQGFMSYWYHFAIMFEAMFILTTIDAGTRIARFILQEAFGKVYKPFGVTNWLPGVIITSLLVVVGWSYFIFSGSILTIWPMFGTANQLLAVIALVVGTSFIINRGKIKYVWITVIPALFLSVTTITACWLNIKNLFYPEMCNPETRVRGGIKLALTIIILTSLLVIVIDTVPRWIKAWSSAPKAHPEPSPVTEAIPDPEEAG